MSGRDEDGAAVVSTQRPVVFVVTFPLVVLGGAVSQAMAEAHVSLMVPFLKF